MVGDKLVAGVSVLVSMLLVLVEPLHPVHSKRVKQVLSAIS